MTYRDIETTNEAPPQVPPDVAGRMRRELLLMLANGTDGGSTTYIVHRVIDTPIFLGNIVLIGNDQEQRWVVNGFEGVTEPMRAWAKAQVFAAAKSVERQIIAEDGERFEPNGNS